MKKIHGPKCPIKGADIKIGGGFINEPPAASAGYQIDEMLDKLQSDLFSTDTAIRDSAKQTVVRLLKGIAKLNCLAGESL